MKYNICKYSLKSSCERDCGVTWQLNVSFLQFSSRSPLPVFSSCSVPSKSMSSVHSPHLVLPLMFSSVATCSGECEGRSGRCERTADVLDGGARSATTRRRTRSWRSCSGGAYVVHSGWTIETATVGW